MFRVKNISYLTRQNICYAGVEHVHHEPGHGRPYRRAHRHPSQRHRLHIRSRYIQYTVVTYIQSR